jgi:hypothetical protein
MEKEKFNIGDKVLYRQSKYNSTMCTIVSNERKERVVRMPDGTTLNVVTDCVIELPNGKLIEQKSEEFYKPNERTIELNGKSKWEVKGVKQNNGYFGSYSLIEYKGKKAIVFCDDRDAIVHVVTDWYDDILYSNDWSGDYRWNNDKPIVVYDKEKGYALNAPHVNELITPYMEELSNDWKHHKELKTYVVVGVKGGKSVYVTKMGNIIDKAKVDGVDYERELNKVACMSIEDIKRDWIEKGKPCAHIRGLEFNGTKRTHITSEQAMKLIKTHTNFQSPFESVEWVMNDGEVTLLFRDYCDSDYD